MGGRKGHSTKKDFDLVIEVEWAERKAGGPKDKI